MLKINCVLRYYYKIVIFSGETRQYVMTINMKKTLSSSLLIKKEDLYRGECVEIGERKKLGQLFSRFSRKILVRFRSTFKHSSILKHLKAR